MPHTLPGLLSFFGVSPRLQWNDAQPASYFDPETRTTWIGEARLGNENEPAFFEIAQVLDDGGVFSLCSIRVERMRDGSWTPTGCTVTGKPVPAEPESMLGVACLAMSHIQIGITPDFDQLLLDLTGLKLPITGYR